MGWGLGCSVSYSLGFSCCCRSRRSSGSYSCVISACYKASSHPLSVLAVICLSLSLASWPWATPCMGFAIMFMMPAPHSLSSAWRVSYFCSLSCIHVITPCHSASLRAAVTATHDCGQVTAILYSQLATRLRSLAIILPIHLYLLLLESTFATIYHNYHTYAYKAELRRKCPYTIIAFQ